MSDGKKVYRAVENALHKLWPVEPRGNVARHVNSLAALISGIVNGRSSQLPKIAENVTDGNKVESRVRRFSRWVNNSKIDYERYYLPFAEALLKCLAANPLVFAIDGSTVGRGCMCLMVSVIYQGRALPIAWLVVRGKKGHLPQDRHVQLVEELKRIVPKEASVYFLGDGEFDGTGLLAKITDYDWHYVCRTAKTASVFVKGKKTNCGKLGNGIQAGQSNIYNDILFTNEQYGPVNLIVWWGKEYKNPIYLVSDLKSKTEACKFYKKRFRIETFFSDQKSRGFHIQKSHISNPDKLARLLMAVCLAYIWIVYLGDLCMNIGAHKLIHRAKRCDLSLFQLGLRYLKHILNEGIKIPVDFCLSPQE
jgi:hypothetical protein